MERTIKTAYNSTHPKDWVLCSKDSFVVKIATFANPQTVNDYFLTTMKLNWKSIFKNKPSSTKDSSDEMEETDYDQHVDFYFTNVINSLILFTYDSVKLNEMAPVLIDPLTELYEELQYAFTPVCFDTVVRMKLINNSLKDELLISFILTTVSKHTGVNAY